MWTFRYDNEDGQFHGFFVVEDEDDDDDDDDNIAVCNFSEYPTKLPKYP
jgi:hypothetical protein